MPFLKREYRRGRRDLSHTALILYVDEGCADVPTSTVENGVRGAVRGSEWDGSGTLYFIAFVWQTGGSVHADLWRFSENTVDKISGPLADMAVFKGPEKVLNFGVASGNTLLVLGLEEAHRRKCVDLSAYLGVPPELPRDLWKA